MVNQKACLEWCVVKTDFNAPGARRLRLDGCGGVNPLFPFLMRSAGGTLTEGEKANS